MGVCLHSRPARQHGRVIIANRWNTVNCCSACRGDRRWPSWPN